MNVLAEPQEVWVASLEDKPGALGEKLAALADGGADLSYIIARRCPEKPGTGVMFVTPLRGDREIDAALQEGFSVSCHIHVVQVEGQNEPGIAAQVTQRVGRAGVNLRGFSGALVGTQFVLHLTFDTAEAALRAIPVIEALGDSWTHPPLFTSQGAALDVLAEHEEVWVAGLEDKPGALGDKLAALADFGADLSYIIARRCPHKPGTGVVFVTPLRGDREAMAALEQGFSVSRHLRVVQVEGRNEPGMAAKVTQRIAQAGLNLRGFSGAVVGTQFVLHLAFDTAEEEQRAISVAEVLGDWCARLPSVAPARV
jgi:hypothetical protein